MTGAGHSEAPAPLKDIIEKYELGAKKALGQHFLLDLNITRKIARLSGLQARETVVEIGPGPGGLTRALLETGADVIAIERDSRCITALRELDGYYDGTLSLIEDDALGADEPALLALRGIRGPVRLASNLPYNISTELLIKWLKASPRWWASMTLMFQREVAERILAAPGSKTYGRLSVIAQAMSTPQRGFHLPARAFTPPPKIDSSVLHFLPETPHDAEVGKLERVTAAAFGQRRKMVRSSLKPVFGDRLGAALSETAIAETARAEEISVSGYVSLAKLV